MNSLFQDAVTLMLAGMGFVFVFLTLLVVATTAMSKLINKYFPEPLPEAFSPPPAAITQQPVAAGEDGNIKTVIALSVAKFRAKHKK